ncbi:hypothetical protein EJ05DRAFT_477832 [Pseudovirgaria hyperparasitica]|uniref:Signal peptidase complex subunit 2 n=1 Tax=Pseudovirgaria hyperparasitica TaxID=470096 RepID=A0A6A6W1F1_9PEZI|nr:uncharacterized protein EJ05DRAFT_477832 [Pseudovirgaria hyperparasitica]KAF2756748.1 hypothetical protein EJ05DRAFT_477832 [Pseudovirgaria hyperparasitica]
MSATTKIAVHSLADLKNTTDDALPVYLTHSPIHFTQTHTKSDVRLVLGYVAVLIAGALFWLDWKQGWTVSKPYTLPAVLVYFTLNSAFTYWIWAVEKGLIFEGVAKTGEKISIASSTKKHTPIYNLTVTITPKSGKPTCLTPAAPFSQWFTADGYFIAKPFQQWLCASIPLVGAQDPNNVVEDIGRGSVIEDAGASGVKTPGGRVRRKA